MHKSRLGSIQLMLSLFLSVVAIILLQNYNSALSPSFLVNLICIFVATAFVLLYFVPTIIIKRRTNLDFLSFAQRVTPSGVVFTAAFYSLFFIYATVFFLIKFCDVFQSSVNPEASVYVVAAVMLAAAIYAAHKGIGAVTRSGIFIFAFSLVTLAVVFCGNISMLDFNVNPLIGSSYSGGAVSSISAFMQPTFAAVIFASVAKDVKKFKARHIVITVISAAIVMLLSVFFIWFVLGNCGTNQPYQLFLLSKAAQIGSTGGMDSLFLALLSMAVFIVASLCLISLKNTCRNSKKPYMTVVYAVIAFALFVCGENINSVKEILISQNVFNFLTFTSAVLLPIIYLIIFRRRLNV